MVVFTQSLIKLLCNYDSNAIIDDGTCAVPEMIVLSDGTISTYNDFCECEGKFQIF